MKNYLSTARRLLCLFILASSVTGFNCYASGVPGDIHFYSTSSGFIGEIDHNNASNATSEIYLKLFDTMGHKPQIELLPFARIEIEAEGEGAVCTFSNLKTSSRQGRLFSKPVAVFFSPRLYQRTDRPAITPGFLDQDNQVKSLSELFNSAQFGSLLMIQARSYGDVLDPQIRAIKDEYKQFRWGADASSMDVRMLLAGRAEFILAYPANMYKQQMRLGGPPLRSYAIAGDPGYVLAYTMCNDRPASRGYIESVNQGLDRLYQDADYLQMHLKYIDEASRPTLQAILVKEGMFIEP